MFELVFKRYAPFNSFGGGFHGDGRVTPNILGSARTWGIVQFTVSEGITSRSAKSSPTFHKMIPSFQREQQPRITISGERKTPDVFSFTAHTEGSNPLVPAAPDIDTFLDLSLIVGHESISITARMRGDDFPNGEAFLRHSGGTELLIDFRSPFGPVSGPATRLFGANAKRVLKTYNGTLPISVAA